MSSSSLYPTGADCFRPELQRDKVLLVEDEDTLAKLGQLILVGAGLAVIRACNGEEAIRQLAEHASEIALAFVDFRLPDMNGDELCLQLRKTVPGLPLLLTSGRARSEMPSGIGEGGPMGFVSKPYLPGELIKQARALLRPVAE